KVFAIVRHAVRHHAQALQLLRVQKLAFQYLALGDVARHVRRTTDYAIAVANRRDGKRDIDFAAVLANAHGLEVLHAFAALQLFQDGGLLVGTVRGKENGHGTALDLVGGVPIDLLGAGIPRTDDAVEILADDG